jgi:hypothetical protein
VGGTKRDRPRRAELHNQSQVASRKSRSVETIVGKRWKDEGRVHGGPSYIGAGHVIAQELGGAVFDAHGIYRYLLWRCWDTRAPRIVFVMLNPSMADATKNDPTIRRCISFACRWGFGSMEVVNLFAYRATDWRELARASDPVGPDNDAYVEYSVNRANLVMVAWGNQGALREQSRRVLFLMQQPIHCLGVTRRGHPRHPLYVNGHTQPLPLSREGSDKPLAIVPAQTGTRGIGLCAS